MPRPEDPKPFECEIFTPQGCQWRGRVVSVTFPASDGLVGVWGDRAPMAALVGAGLLTIEDIGGGTTRRFVSGGFARVGENRLTLLAEEYAAAEELDRDEALREFQRAKALPARTAAQADRRQSVLDATRRKLRIAEGRGASPGA
jgi:F-type H+-transporting ATPase subunit epsilon